MSLLVKGMGMPKKAYKDIDGTLWSNGRFTLTKLNNTMSDYEVVEVPTPHGRLGDLDAAIMLLQKYYDREQDVLKQHAIGECIMIIKDDVPTIIKAEE